MNTAQYHPASSPTEMGLAQFPRDAPQRQQPPQFPGPQAYPAVPPPPPPPHSQQYPHPHASLQSPYPQPIHPFQPGQAQARLIAPPGSSGLPPLQAGSRPRSATPPPESFVQDGRRYQLVVVQQPQRARMCGFGDKDRRPITPPPCVQLIITDAKTGKEIDCNEIDHSMFVLTVDLWSEAGLQEVNLVKHSPTSPSISATAAVSYHEFNQATPPYHNPGPAQNEVKYESSVYTPFQTTNYSHQPSGSSSGYGEGSQYQQPYSPAGSTQYSAQNGYTQPGQGVPFTTGPQIHAQGHTNLVPQYPGAPPGNYQSSTYAPPEIPPNPARPSGRPVGTSPPSGMYTRNLIGSLAATAFRLSDPGDRIGIWFVLQDLSIRTEGLFRLRFSFVNVGVPIQNANGSTESQGCQANTGSAPILATCFSSSFDVYSAKRFPGVVESTALSKCFATQGIKIPIRKDGDKKIIKITDQPDVEEPDEDTHD